ncbi:hypothetical protein STAQ_14750 [Allostella sp. ATCC 35155]|nr:hypothetical protein STAQ_14750 [Stella sp. ATCC 35155]
MTASARRMTFDEFRARIERDGIPCAPDRLEALHDAYEGMMAQTDRVRRAVAYADEPATIFPPEGRR